MSSRRPDDHQSARVPVGAPEGVVTISSALGLSQQAETPTHAPYVRFTPQYLVPRVASNVVDEVFADHDVETTGGVKLTKAFEAIKAKKEAAAEKYEKLKKNLTDAKTSFDELRSTTAKQHVRNAWSGGAKAYRAAQSDANDVVAEMSHFNYKIYDADTEHREPNNPPLIGRIPYENPTAILGVMAGTEAKHTKFPGPFVRYVEIPPPVPTDGQVTPPPQSMDAIMKRVEKQANGMKKNTITTEIPARIGGEPISTYNESPGRVHICMGFASTHVDASTTDRFLEDLYQPDVGAVEGVPTLKYIVASCLTEGGVLANKPITGLVMEHLTTEAKQNMWGSGGHYIHKIKDDDQKKTKIANLTTEIENGFDSCIRGLHVGIKEKLKTLQVGPMILVPKGKKACMDVNNYRIFTDDDGLENALSCAMENDKIDLAFLWTAYTFANGVNKLSTAGSVATPQLKKKDQVAKLLLGHTKEVRKGVTTYEEAFGADAYDALNAMRVA